MKKSKKLYLVISLLLVCITVNIIGVSQTMAWFVSGGIIGTGDYSTAKVQYLPTLEPDSDQKGKYGSLIDGSTKDKIVFLIPGDTIIEKFGENTDGYLSLENFSTVPSEVRVCIECNFINTDETTGTAVDVLDPMTGFEWRSMGGDVYQYGKKHTTGEGQEIFMGLFEAKFANKQVKDTMYPGYVAPVDDATDTTQYGWVLKTNSDTYPADKVDFTNCWDLKLGNGTIIPPAKTADDQLGRAYNVITDMKIVGENLTDQGLFDTYFSNNYAGKRIRISVKYYAKQTMGMEWNLFGEELLTTITPNT